MNLAANAHPSRRLAVYVLAGTLLGTAGLTACGSTRGGSASGDPAPAGQVVSLAGYRGPAVISADGRTITIGGFPGPCFGAVRAAARESGHLVKLYLRYSAPAQHGVCNKDVALILARTVRLPAPLGHRALADGATGKPLTVFDGRRMLSPTAVPAGLRLRYLSPVVLTGGTLLGAAEEAGASQFYSSAKATLTIVQTAGHLSLPAPDQGRPVTVKVRGHEAKASGSAILWREHGLNMLISAASTGSGKAPLTVRQLIVIADSAPPIPA